MQQKLILFMLVILSATCINACSVNRIYLSKTPRVFEADLVRACEFLHAAKSGTNPLLRSRHETMEALKSISPPGRLCFVCRRLRLCEFTTEGLKMGQKLDARTMIENTVSHFGKKLRTKDLPEPGGISLEQARMGMCRACATMPVRIQDGTWVEPPLEKEKS